jgi:general secretion pathway protein D
VVAANDLGYGNETIALKFVNAEELRKLLDPLVPNAISVADPASNLLVVSGNSTQRRALRELVAQFDVDWLRGMSFGLFVPERTDARLIAPELEKLLNAPGSPSAGLVRLIAMDQLNGILAISPQPQYLDDVRRFVEILDREGESAERRVFVYHVQNGRAADLAKVLNTAYGNAQTGGSNTDTGPTELVDRTESKAPNSVAATNPLVAGLLARAATAAVKNENAAAEGARGGSAGSGTTITADETNNAIVVFSTPRDFALIEDALRKLDVPPLQVMIDATISEVTLNHALQYGIQWSFKSGNSSGALTQPNAAGIATNIPQQNFPGFSYLYSGGSVTATLNALATITDVTTLSAPKLMVLNNHTATIQVGDQVPISTGTAVSTLTTPAPIVNSIDYRDTGIILKITPRVNAGGLVLLDIAQEVSDVVPLSTTQIASGIQSPTIEQRKISTSVAVQDGETVALGGLIKNEVQKGRSTIPILGSIPIIGHIFGDTTGGLIRTELVVLLTPRVVRTPVDARTITEQLRGKLEEAPGPPPPPPPKVSTRRARHGP